ncbi:MAG TPA: 2OG-Fe(II) oxygenase [Casimicrobiaceae bacterium]|nr:2OG-Fe(II) oxygenase [Casimicrobiaceae bacterium]
MAGDALLRECLGEHALVAGDATAFATAQPFPHVVIDDFLAESFALQLIEAFPAFDSGTAIGDDGKAGGKSTYESIARLRGPYAKLDALIASPAWLSYLSRVTGIPSLLYDPFYLGGGTHENRSGQSLDPHVDFNLHPSERWHRRLNLIIYLNRGWESSWGGALELYADPACDMEAAVRLEPLFNRCVIFETSERSWHGFTGLTIPDDRPDVTRKSIALYFYSKTRPPVEIAGKHSTIYVKRPLPARFAAGLTLGQRDVEELKALIAARDAQIRMQYEEIARLLQAQERGFTGQLLYLAKRAYVRLRR